MAETGDPPRVADAARRLAYEAVATVPLTVLGVGFIACYSALVLTRTMPAWAVTALVTGLVVAWFAMFVDLVVRVALTPRGARLRFLVRHPFDVLAVVLPVFRALRVVELSRGIPSLNRATGDGVRARVLTYAVVYAVIFVYFIALATLHVERDAVGATITDFGTAIWWACVTIATVGYGDTYPVTGLGRVYAVMLMLGGVAIIGTTSALFVTVISERIRRVTNRDHDHPA